MVNIVIEVSKYLLILLIAAYTYWNFSYFRFRAPWQQGRVCVRQNVAMFLLHFVAYAVLFLKSEDERVILFYLAQTGHIGILEVVNDTAEQNCQVPRLVQEERVDGVIVMGNFSKAYRNMLAETEIPLVVLDAFDARYHRDSVISDGYYGMYTMVDYLLQMGHRDIVFVGSVNATSSITDRYYGYCRAMREAGVTVTEDHILPDRDAEGKVTVSLERLSKLPTAFACNCDVTAYVLLNALKENGIRVPEDVSVVGFDDYILADLAVPSLTTYAIDVDHMAKVSAQQLIRRIQKPEAEVRRIVVSGKLVIRESVQKHSGNIA